MVSESIPRDVREFVAGRDGVEGVVQHVGRETWDLVLIDPDGNWTRVVTTSKEAGEAIAAELGVPAHDGWDTDELAKRMNRRDHWNEPGGQRRAV